MPYEPTFESVRRHPLPSWYDGAKFGIFIHWGLFSVPGWAYAERGKSIVDLGEDSEPFHAQKYNPYAEWYLNTLRIEGSPGRQYHLKTYGNKDYYSFREDFEQACAAFDPRDWAELFRRAGARYAVLVTKHHDGYCLWPSAFDNPRRPGLHSRRDLVGETADAVRAAGLRMGLYYSGIFDWTFKTGPIQDARSWIDHYLAEDEYAAYSLAQTRELIHRYHPSILWNDMGYPAQCDLNALFAEYYNTVDEGVINDRWIQRDAGGLSLEEFTRAEQEKGDIVECRCDYGDFTSPEYDTVFRYKKKKWELTRGIGMSFGYNRNEDPANFMTGREIIDTLADVVSKNGNLLLNVGPMADGTIEPAQRDALLETGRWLAVNGEAIYDTDCIPEQPETVTDRGCRVSLTSKGGFLYAIVQDPDPQKEVLLRDFRPALASDRATVPGAAGEAACAAVEGGLRVTLPESTPKGSAYTIRFRIGE